MTRIVALAIVLTAPLSLLRAASARFLDYRDYLLTSSTVTLTTADVNSDGVPDVVAGTAAGIAVLLGRADGTLAAPVIAGEYQVFIVSLTAADFNNDGKPDIVAVAASNAGNFLILALGNGDGTFQRPTPLPINCVNYSCVVASADFNGDGNMDLAVGAGPESSVTVYLGDGKGGFKGGQPQYGFHSTLYVIAGDLNQDGKPDLVVSDNGANSVVVLLGNGDGSFRRRDYNYGYRPFGLALGDFNGDGKPDVAVSDGLSAKISVWLNLGDGTLGKPSNMDTNCTLCNLQSIAAGDFNHDGKVDLATPMSILHGNGDGTFQPPVNFISGNGPVQVASADFNRDGYTDLVIGNSTTNLSLLFGDARSVQQPPAASAGNSPRALLTADFNGDGLADFAVADTGANQVRITLGHSGGTFRQSPGLNASEPGALAAADFNGDGKVDLAVAGETGTTIFLGNGDGTFTPGANYPGFYGDCTMNQWPAHMCFAAADFNNDGIPDLAGALWIQDQLFFLLGNGDGTFHPGPTITVSDTPQGLAVGDFNHDGNMDVVISGYAGTVQVFPGNGDGTFGDPVIIQFQFGALAGLAVGDLDGDGNPDIVVAGGGGASFLALDIFVVTGNGDFTFNPALPLLTDQMPNGILLGDFNGDGKMDIASANAMADNVAILVNRGNLKFAPAVLYGADQSPVMLVSADLNGNDKPDLLVLNQNSNDVTVLPHAPK